MENQNLKDLLFLVDFMKENRDGGQLSHEDAKTIEVLYDEYKLPVVDDTCSIISGDFGILGSVVIREVVKTEDKEIKLKYKPNSYDYISIKCKTKRILWTDYKNIEPYDRQSGLYCDGASFECLGNPVLEKNEYREFVAEDKFEHNLMFGVWGFSFNDFYGSVQFGLCIKKELVDEFIQKLRKIINK